MDDAYPGSMKHIYHTGALPFNSTTRHHERRGCPDAREFFMIFNFIGQLRVHKVTFKVYRFLALILI
ncbi:MAG: hypothetical protein ACE5E2_04340 [Candidatus Binatia bacterium]